jgi:hypothetical protein
MALHFKIINNFFLALGILFSCIISVQAQNGKTIMYSNKKTITLYNGDGKNDWTITPSLKVDILRYYSTTETFRKFRFVSDIDSLEFNVEVNKPVYFSILYNGDTAYTAIEFTNQIPNTLSDEEKIYALSLFYSEVNIILLLLTK